MSKTLNFEIPESLYDRVAEYAQFHGSTPSAVALKALQDRFGEEKASSAARPDTGLRLSDLFGSITGDYGTSDNKSIDDDLAREYADPHEAH